MEVIVEDKQLSLAIGKKGQNVRLAAKLTGWKIDIKSEEEKRREVEAQLGALEIGEPASEGDIEAPLDPDAATPASAADAEAQLVAGGEDTHEADVTKPDVDTATEEQKQSEG
jgi:transcription termination/antitermination protein NusA